ncbi:hypothetical protein K2173_018433 [Erythroxylum novogranatense]|uniref:Uncharacterized protein n=1 Tax=Erythroxylum novogranatense TaxID=1862640 RepID=A0AAV8UAJ9_9ROSI|nr:hypothetical protein K2173_018433 [Erythroxylum novogranatense]
MCYGNETATWPDGSVAGLGPGGRGCGKDGPVGGGPEAEAAGAGGSGVGLWETDWAKWRSSWGCEGDGPKGVGRPKEETRPDLREVASSRSLGECPLGRRSMPRE